MRWLGEIATAGWAGGAALGMIALAAGTGASGQSSVIAAPPFASTPDAPAPAASPAPPPAESLAPEPAPSPLSEAVVVTVNDEIISTYDIVQRMRLLIVTSGIQPTPQNLPDIQGEAVRSLVDEHLEMQELAREAKTQKFDLIASDAEVNDELADIARSNNTSADQLLAQLAAQGVGATTFRDQLKAEISWRGWIRGRYGQRLSIGEDQIKAYQKRLEAEGGKPQYDISEVYIDAGRVGGEAVAQQGAAQLIAQLQKGAPFAAVARQFSASPSAAKGGNVGWISTGEMPPEVDRALASLRPGQLSAPIPVKDGVYIIFLRDRRAGGATTLINLKQVAIALPKTAGAGEVASANAKLEALRPRLNGCDNLAAEAAKTPGAVSGDLGEAESKDLAPAFRQAAESLQVGQVSAPIRTDAGLHLIAVCGRRQGGAGQLKHDDIVNRLYGQELAMIAKRQLRDLRNSATIEKR
jgi:peptidyl-prolyl cis-trans isomerase SurA